LYDDTYVQDCTHDRPKDDIDNDVVVQFSGVTVAQLLPTAQDVPTNALVEL